MIANGLHNDEGRRVSGLPKATGVSRVDLERCWLEGREGFCGFKIKLFGLPQPGKL